MAGGTARDRSTVRAGRRLAQAVSRVTGLPVLHQPRLRGGHRIELLECGAAFFPALIAAIDAATAQVHLETYILHEDASSRRVLAALARAARRGVAVRLLIDGFGTPLIPERLRRLMLRAGVQLQIFRPEDTPYMPDRQRLRRLHRKLAVIDRQVALVGGLNLLDDHEDPNHGRLDRPRLDFAVRVRGPLVMDAHAAAYQLWLRLLAPAARRALTRSVDPVACGAAPSLDPSERVFGPVRAKLLLRDNFRFRRAIEAEYLRAIDAARHRVLIANAYFFPGLRMRRALRRAAARGVAVTLLLQGRVEYRLQHYASQALYEELLASGVRIIEYDSSFMHAKVAVADDWATVGSSNIDPFSLLLAREANVVVRDAAFAQHLASRILAAIDGGGRPVLAQHHAQRGLPVRLAHWAAFSLLRVGVALSGEAARY